MLSRLHIENYVLIERLDLEFDGGFSVLTGETGAGKSVLMAAIALILGQRADLSVIKEGQNRCVLEAEFTEVSPLKTYFEANDLEYDDSVCLLRRELYASGKSRAFVNDSAVSLQILKDLGSLLVDVHSQNANLSLGDERFQLDILDRIAGSQKEKNAYSSIYQHYQESGRQLEALRAQLRRDAEERDYLQFQYTQLEEAQLQEGEQAMLEEELDLLSHTGEIKSAVETVCAHLSDDEYGICSRLSASLRALSHLKFPSIDDIRSRLDASLADLKDLLRDLERTDTSIELNPKRIEQIEDRLGHLFDLQQKHHVHDADGLIAIRDSLARRLQGMNRSSDEVERLEAEREACGRELEIAAQKLTERRLSVKDGMQRYMETQLQSLGMPYARFSVERQAKTPDPDGADRIVFMFSANKNQSLQPAAQVASGGETARLMLCLKALTADVQTASTCLFDEIDTGVSGAMAHRMALLMREMAEHRQVLCITHLPQIAALGDHHYKVYKSEAGEQAISSARQLNEDERAEEIASMLGSGEFSPAALENARQLLAEGRKCL